VGQIHLSRVMVSLAWIYSLSHQISKIPQVKCIITVADQLVMLVLYSSKCYGQG